MEKKETTAIKNYYRLLIKESVNTDFSLKFLEAVA